MYVVAPPLVHVTKKLYGLGAGVVAASALDTIFLAKGERAAWTPVAAPTRGGIALGVAGPF